LTEAALLLNKRCERLEHDLLRLGLNIVSFNSIDEALKDCLTRRPDLIIVGSDPATLRQVAARLRQSEQTGHAYLMALVKNDAIKAIKSSVDFDDVLLTEYADDELRLRLALMTARTVRSKRSKLFVGDMSIDIDSYEVTVEDTPVPMTHREYELLKFLATHRGQVFTRDVLVRKVWKYEYSGGNRTVDVHIRRLRVKLGPRYGELIETIRNVGYRFSRHEPG
jgi:DNA-binding response OmpR family regulator